MPESVAGGFENHGDSGLPAEPCIDGFRESSVDVGGFFRSISDERLTNHGRPPNLAQRS
jgi:hypothetical protein